MGKTIKERITEFIKAKQITVREFERRSGLSNGYVNAMRKGIGTEKLENVLSAFSLKGSLFRLPFFVFIINGL